MSQHEILVTVEVPPETPHDAAIFVAGDFNAWHPSSPAHRLRSNGDGKFSLRFFVFDEEAKLKITRGSWDTAECDGNGLPVVDHIWTLDEIDEPMNLAVEAWLDLKPEAAPFRPRHTLTGDIRVVKDVHFDSLGRYVDLIVYLPPSYETALEKRFPVLYMHDGQNLFDEVTAYAGEWQVDESCETLAREHGLELIVVGIPNAGRRRLLEYSPWQDEHLLEGGRGEEYLNVITGTVKPLIDAQFRTSADRQSTGIMGSSMGGLISLYAGFRRPDIFGVIGAMSPSIGFAAAQILEFARFSNHAEPLRIYLDCGGNEFPGFRARSQRYVSLTQEMAQALVKPQHDVKLIVEPQASHSETAWGRRFSEAVKFMFRR